MTLFRIVFKIKDFYFLLYKKLIIFCIKNFILNLFILSSLFYGSDEKRKILKSLKKLNFTDETIKTRFFLKSFIEIKNSNNNYKSKLKLFNLLFKLFSLNFKKNFIKNIFDKIIDKSFINNNQIKLINDIKLQKLSNDKEIIFLKNFFYNLGLYKISYFLRIFLERQKLNQKNIYKKKDFISLFNISLFTDDKKAAEKSLINLEKFIFFNSSCKFFSPKKCFNLFFQDNKKYDFSKFSVIDLKFLELINNKSIAIVGPADTTIHNGDEIDKFDIVVRMNKENEIENELEVFTGSRTDINYFGGEILRYRRDKIYEYIYKSNTKFLCVKNYEVLKNFNTNIVPARQWLEFPWNFESSHMMVQNIILDILFFNPEKIKLFNVDFYLGKKKYLSNNYKSNIYKKSPNIRPPVFDLHDPFVNYRLVKLLLKKKLIDVDESIKKILMLSDRHYIKKLEIANQEKVFKMIY